MTAVFVHGFPETSIIWDSLRKELDRDSLALALPGFATPARVHSLPPRTPTRNGSRTR
jgi:pimeloyl-ACP methyl ester carboxylesterase